MSYASHRQNRTFLPPAEYNPLAPMKNPQIPTELPDGDYDVAVFENLFPALAPTPGLPPELSVKTASGLGACEVVVFDRDSKATLGGLPLSQIELIFEVWTERFREIGARPGIEYVMPFENRGVEVGVTLHHPHGQIYAYSFVPPVAVRELELQKKYWSEHKTGLLENVIQSELKDACRILYQGPEVVAFLPPFARYPYEVWVAPYRTCPTLADLTVVERLDYARALKTVLLKFDGLWSRPFPYLMAFHQAPTKGVHPWAHVHTEFYPAYRTKDRLKYLAGTELGAGMFANDALPEDKAKELQAVKVQFGATD